MEKILEFFASLLNELDVPRRWIAIISAFLLAIVMVISFEWATGYFYYRSLEKKVVLLREMQKMANEGIITNTVLHPVYQATAQEIALRQIKPLSAVSISIADPVIFWKATSGALFFGALAIAALFGAFGEGNKAIGTIFCAVLAVIAGYISAIIPTIWNPWVNYIASPIIQLLFILFVGGRAQKAS